MNKFAQVNQENIVVNVFTTTREYAPENSNIIAVLESHGAVDVGMRYENNQFVTVEPEPATYIHKSFFKQRLIPYAEDLRTAKAADAKVEAYFDLLNEYKGVDVEWQQTIAMINDAVTRVKAVVPESAINADELLLPLQPHETFE